MNRSVNDKGLIVKRIDLHARRQPQARDSFLHSFDELLAVFAFEHDDHARYGFTVSQRGPLWRSGPDAYFSEVLQQDRRAVFGGQYNIAKILRTHGPSRAPNGELFGGMLDVTSAEIHVIGFDARSHVMQRQAVGLEERWIHYDLILLGLASPR